MIIVIFYLIAYNLMFLVFSVLYRLNKVGYEAYDLAKGFWIFGWLTSALFLLV